VVVSFCTIGTDRYPGDGNRRGARGLEWPIGHLAVA